MKENNVVNFEYFKILDSSTEPTECKVFVSKVNEKLTFKYVTIS